MSGAPVRSDLWNLFEIMSSNVFIIMQYGQTTFKTTVPDHILTGLVSPDKYIILSFNWSSLQQRILSSPTTENISGMVLLLNRTASTHSYIYDPEAENVSQ